MSSGGSEKELVEVHVLLDVSVSVLGPSYYCYYIIHVIVSEIETLIDYNSPAFFLHNPSLPLSL